MTEFRKELKYLVNITRNHTHTHTHSRESNDAVIKAFYISTVKCLLKLDSWLKDSIIID
jgi:hypothetical protein